MAAGARRGGVRHRRRRSARSGTRSRHHSTGGDPPELRHAAGQRRRQRGPPDRAAALPDGRLAPPCRRSAAVELGLVQALRTGRARAPGGAGRAPGPSGAAHPQHEHHRRRSAARDLARVRPQGRGADRLQQQPGRGGATVEEGGGRFHPRRPVHRGPRAFPHRHRRPRRLRAAGNHPARAPGRAHHLRPHRCDVQRAGYRPARSGQAEHADLPRSRGAHGLHRAVLR